MYSLKIKKGAFTRLQDSKGKLLGEEVTPEPIYVTADTTIEARRCETEGCKCTVIAIWLKERCLLVDAEDVEIVPPREMKSRDTLSDDDEAAA